MPYDIMTVASKVNTRDMGVSTGDLDAGPGWRFCTSATYEAEDGIIGLPYPPQLGPLKGPFVCVGSTRGPLLGGNMAPVIIPKQNFGAEAEHAVSRGSRSEIGTESY